MDFDFNLLIGPIIGGVIGYFTNAIAIKMLFRPLRPLYIFKIRIPFTPGIIPKGKPRLAKSIAAVVSSDLLNSEVLKQTLLNDEMIANLYKSLDQIEKDLYVERLTFQLALNRVIDQDQSDKFLLEIQEKASNYITERIKKMHIGDVLSKQVVEEVKNKFEGGSLSFLSSIVDSKIINNIAGKIGESIDEAVNRSAKNLILDTVVDETDRFLDKDIATIIEENKVTVDKMKKTIVDLYIQAIENNLENILNVVNIKKVVEDKVNSLDVLEVEKIIFSIMNKELKVVIWLGAILGFLIGFANLFIKF